MSYISALNNQNREIRATGTSTATAAAGTTIVVVLNNWEPYSSLDRLVITANNTISSAITATVVTDAAGYLAATGQAKAAFIVEAATGTMANNRLELLFSGIHNENAFGLPLLHVVLTSGSAMTTGTIFTILAEGKQQQPENISQGDTNTFKYDSTFRVLNVNALSVVTDLTDSANNGAIRQVINPSPIKWLNADTDYLYVGSVTPPTKLYFNLASQQAAGTTLTAQYWNGAAWTSTTVQDNTSDGQATPSTFSYAGVITIPTQSTWATSQIATDPLWVQVQAILAGTAFPGTLINCPARYWVRFQLTGGTYPVVIGKLGQVR